MFYKNRYEMFCKQIDQAFAISVYTANQRKFRFPTDISFSLPSSTRQRKLI